jgi:hypothetical protein
LDHNNPEYRSHLEFAIANSLKDVSPEVQESQARALLESVQRLAFWQQRTSKGQMFQMLMFQMLMTTQKPDSRLQHTSIRLNYPLSGRGPIESVDVRQVTRGEDAAESRRTLAKVRPVWGNSGEPRYEGTLDNIRDFTEQRQGSNRLFQYQR